jgi:sugar phosphate isomerase/epimerase
MNSTIARRDFLKTVGAGALAGAGLAGSAPLARAAQADAGVSLQKRPRLLSSCCAYSYRELLMHGKMTMEEFILKAVELGVDAVDMTVYYLKSTEPAYLDGLRQLAFKNAVTLSGAGCGASMVQADAAKREDALRQIKKWVDVTDRLGASHLRIFAGPLPEGATLQQATDWTVETMKASCGYAAEKGITLGLEDHFGVSQSADVCLEVMRRVNSPYAAINLDLTHFVPTPAQDGYAQIAACIPYATVAHVRDHFDDGAPLDLDRVGRMFAEAGFKGYLAVEYDADSHGGEAAITGVPKLLAKTREICRKYSSV